MYIVIECWPDAASAAIVTDPETGSNMVFDEPDKANAEASECQDGKVMEIN
jgi:hypothetical protein